jgi:hypothetical protein
MESSNPAIELRRHERPLRICLENLMVMGDPPRVMRRKTVRATSADSHNPLKEKTTMSRFVSKQKLLVGVLVISSLGIGYAMGAQPRMDAALALLQNARAELEAAVPNKGGHRERAIELVDRAIVQVREGIAFAATH